MFLRRSSTLSQSFFSLSSSDDLISKVGIGARLARGVSFTVLLRLITTGGWASNLEVLLVLFLVFTTFLNLLLVLAGSATASLGRGSSMCPFSTVPFRDRLYILSSNSSHSSRRANDAILNVHGFCCTNSMVSSNPPPPLGDIFLMLENGMSPPLAFCLKYSKERLDQRMGLVRQPRHLSSMRSRRRLFSVTPVLDFLRTSLEKRISPLGSSRLTMVDFMVIEYNIGGREAAGKWVDSAINVIRISSMYKLAVWKLLEQMLMDHQRRRMETTYGDSYKQISDYVIDLHDVLGQGSFSTVYRARHAITSHHVAIKVIKLASLVSPKLHELLEQEITILKSLQHPNVLKCLEVFKSANHCYIVSELCEEGNLDTRLKANKGAFSEEAASKFIIDIYKGLQYLNDRNIIHRDLKLANVFLKNGVAKIADFGFAKEATSKFHDESIGSPMYMAPEALCGQYYSSKTDVWAFGELIYQLTHGLPHLIHCTTQSRLATEVTKPLQPHQLSSNLSKDLKQLILGCLEVKECDRLGMEEIEHTQFMACRLEKKKIFYNNFIKKEGPLSIFNQSSGMSFLVRQKPKTDISNFSKNASLLVKPNRYTGKENKQAKDIKDTKDTKQKELSKDALINGILTFNEAIGMINFCRLTYRFFTSCNEKELKGKACWIIKTILEEMLAKAESKCIVHEVAENIFTKELKLITALKEYLSRYTEQFSRFTLITVDMEQFLGQVRVALKEAETSGANVKASYFSLLMEYYLGKLNRCRTTGCFKAFGLLISLERELRSEKLPKTLAEYEEIRARMRKLQGDTHTRLNRM